MRYLDVRYLAVGLVVGVIAAILPSCSDSKASEADFDVNEALTYCHRQVGRALNNLRGDDNTIDYTYFPRNIEGADSTWHCRKNTPDEWCNGFWPGILWLDYEATHDEADRDEADRYTSSLEYLAQRSIFDHDLGFIMYCSFGNAYSLTHNQEYKEILLAAADSLATLFNPVVGTILSWPRNVEMLGGHNTIMDNMMNLEMLFWAAKNGGSKNLYDIAVKHAETTMAHQFRSDYSCYHVAVYDEQTGEFIKGITHQGLNDESMWARGQAWAIYGYTMVYRETGDSRFLDFAQKVTDVYLNRLPDDLVPYWDFDAPHEKSTPRDASAACVVASALLELSEYVAGEKSAYYRDMAEKMLASLSSTAYRSGNARCSFLDHSVGNYPAGSEIDAAIVYADYYYLEALLRLKKLQSGASLLAAL
jgi:unsaturated chondroitin disaccharide hydrolase